jgi:phosphoribosyl-ATP pyrophosphohydrolase
MRNVADGVRDRNGRIMVRLQTALQTARTGELGSARTHKPLTSGVPKMAQKLVEEAAETAIEAVRDQRDTFIQESADLLFNLAVLWQALEIKPSDIWAEMDRRETLFGLAEKLPKPDELS